jgi:predicted nucleotidyltransferase
MASQPYLFPKIKEAVHQLVPDARVILFGSQAAGTATEESDWNVLALTQQPVGWEFNWKLWDHVFPLSLKEGTVISLMIVQEQDWNENPAYYALQLSISRGNVITWTVKKLLYS